MNNTNNTKRNKHDQQECLYPREIREMAKNGNLRTLEIIPGILDGSKILRLDFISKDPPRVFGACGILFKKDISPFELTDNIRQLADELDKFLCRNLRKRGRKNDGKESEK